MNATELKARFRELDAEHERLKLERRVREDRTLEAVAWVARPLLVATAALWCYLLFKIAGQFN